MTRGDSYDEARHNVEAAKLRVDSIRERTSRVVAELSGDPGTPVERLPRYVEARAAYDAAMLDLSRTTIKAPYAGSWFTVELPSDAGIVVAGLRGNVWRSDDFGANWAQLAAPTTASVVASARRADGSLVFVDQAGLVLAAPPATDGALRPMPGAPLPPLTAVLPLADGAVLALSVQGVHVLPPVAVVQEIAK